MLCKVCGKEIAEDDLFCGNCGSYLKKQEIENDLSLSKKDTISDYRVSINVISLAFYLMVLLLFLISNFLNIFEAPKFDDISFFSFFIKNCFIGVDSLSLIQISFLLLSITLILIFKNKVLVLKIINIVNFFVSTILVIVGIATGYTMFNFDCVLNSVATPFMVSTFYIQNFLFVCIALFSIVSVLKFKDKKELSEGKENVL